MLDDLDGLAGCVGTGGGAADHQCGIIEPNEAARDSIGQPALLSHLAIKSRGERPAAEDVVDDIGGHEVRITATDAGPAEIYHRLRDVELDHDPPTKALRRHRSDGGKLGFGR